MRPTSPCSDLTISVVGQANLSSDLVALTTIRSTMDPHVLPFVIPLARTELIDDSTLRNHILNSLRHLPPEQFLLLHMLTLEAWWNKPTHRLLAKFTEQLSSALAVTELILRSLVWPEPAGLVALCQGFPKLRRIHLVGVRWGKPWKPYRPSAIHGVPNLPSHVTELHMLGGLHTLESQTSSVLLLHSLSYTLTKLVLDVPTVSDITSGFEDLLRYSGTPPEGTTLPISKPETIVMRQLTCLVVKLPAETNAHLPEQEVALENAVRGLLAKLMPPNPNSSNLRSSIPVSYVYTEAMGSEGTLNAVVPALEWSLWRIRESSREFRSE